MTRLGKPREVRSEDLDLSEFIGPGDTVMWSQATAEPLTLTEALVRQRSAIGPFKVFLGVTFSNTVRPEHADVMSFMALGGVGYNRKFVSAGALDILPCHLTDLQDFFERGLLHADVVLVQLSPENSDGAFSFGAGNSYLEFAMRHARTVVAEVNDQAPWTYALNEVPRGRIDVVVRTSRPLVELKPPRPIGEVDIAISKRVAELVPDGAVVQIGIGTIPNAVLSALHAHRNLGIHSGVIGDSVIDLIECGAVTNATKPFDKGVSVTNALFGTERLNRFSHQNPALRVEPVSHTHVIEKLRQFETLIAINSAIEVDLTGQINGEVAGKNYVGTVGGQTDFARGALATPRGRSIIALPSRVGTDGPSCIVPRIESGVVTTARTDADVVISEFGTAQLRGRTISERVRMMISIAHPAFRADLEQAARERIPGYR